MFKQKELDIIEDKYGLSIEFSWFTSSAFFLIFFCIVWDSFLLFWYSNLGFGAPWIFYVFPLGHLAVGVSLSYYTLCLLFNKTLIDVSDGHLWVSHSPIPWWKGNVDIPVDQIEQIFVKEKQRQSNNSASSTYILSAKLRDGTTQKLLDTGIMDSEKAIELEELIENYLGIEDVPIKGEFGTVRNVSAAQPKRRQKRRLSAQNFELIGKHTGDEVHLYGDYYQVLHDSQYDWKNGNSDKLLQLSNASSKNILVYIQQNGGVHDTFFEEKLSLYLSNEIAFNEAQPANQFQYQGVQYQLHDFSEGETFLSDQQHPIATKQWLYQSANKKQNIRIISNNNMLTYYMGNTDGPNDYFDLDDEILDINIPQKEVIKPWRGVDPV